MFYADNQALAAVGNYADTAIWPLTDFKQDDSNWTYSVATIKLDNRAPTVSLGGIVGDNTSVVSIPVTIMDEHSDIETGSYQWVKDGDEFAETDWNSVQLSDNGATLTTLNEVPEDGNYWLYVYAKDKAGNERLVKSEKAVSVNSADLISGAFEPQANPDYVQSHEIQFKLSGLGNFAALSSTSVTTATYSAGVSGLNPMVHTATTVTDSVYAAYAFSESAMSPGEADFIHFAGYSGDHDERTYVVPVDSSKNGMQYVHVKVKVNDGDIVRNYSFSKAYYFDNLAPDITFSKSGVDYPQAVQRVTVEAHKT